MPATVGEGFDPVVRPSDDNQRYRARHNTDIDLVPGFGPDAQRIATGAGIFV